MVVSSGKEVDCREAKAVYQLLEQGWVQAPLFLGSFLGLLEGSFYGLMPLLGPFLEALEGFSDFFHAQERALPCFAGLESEGPASGSLP